MSDKAIIITIDGPAGVGKSSLAGRLAEELGVACLDTGAMFRKVALHLAERLGDTELQTGPGLAALLDECAFALEGRGAQTRLLYNGTPVGDEVRSEKAGMMAAKVAGIPQVRDFLKARQQQLGAKFSLVAEGRDMGTVVFPSAACKFFLDASPEVRAKRRYLQLQELGQESDLAVLTAQIAERDANDRNRAVAPLKAADDACVIDTSTLNINEVFALMKTIAESRSQNAPVRVDMRRKDRALAPDAVQDVLNKSEYGILALNDSTGWPYAVPLSFVHMDGALYVHCASSGRKNTLISQCDKASFTTVCDTKPVYLTDFSTYYKSVMVFGRISEVNDKEEKNKALQELAKKYLPDHMDKADEGINKYATRTKVFKLSMEEVSGKGKTEKE